jgi:hypothetical protein
MTGSRAVFIVGVEGGGVVPGQQRGDALNMEELPAPGGGGLVSAKKRRNRRREMGTMG